MSCVSGSQPMGHEPFEDCISGHPAYQIHNGSMKEPRNNFMVTGHCSMRIVIKVVSIRDVEHSST